MKKLFMLVLIMATISVLMLVGETQTSTAAPTTSAPSAAPKSGGNLKIGIGAGPANLGNPGKPFIGPDVIMALAAVEGLFSFDEKDPRHLIPKLALSYQLSSDMKSITFTLRQGVKFHDGTPFNAEAVKFNIELRNAGAGVAVLKTITSMDIIDDYTIKCDLSSYSPALMTAFWDGNYIISPTAYKAMGDEAYLHPVGTGPFKFVSYKRDLSLRYERNDNYWGSKPYLDGIEFVIIKDPVTQLLSFQKGEIDALFGPSAKDSADLQAKGYTIFSLDAGCQGLLGDSGNLDSPFSKLEVRQALAYAIDNKALSDAVGYGFYTPTNQLASPKTSYYYNPDVVGYPYDPEKAKELLAKAGYPDGFDTKLTYLGSPEWTEVYTIVQGYLANVNINVTLDPADFGRSIQLFAGGWKNQMVQLLQPASVDNDPYSTLSERFSEKSSFYAASSIELPQAYLTQLNAANVEPNSDKREAMFRELERMMIDDYCMAVPLYVDAQFMAVAPYVQDFDLSKYSIQDSNLQKAWLNK